MLEHHPRRVSRREVDDVVDNCLRACVSVRGVLAQRERGRHACKQSWDGRHADDVMWMLMLMLMLRLMLGLGLRLALMLMLMLMLMP